jgi:hypothetical protein
MTIVADWGGISSNSYVSVTDASSFITSAIINHSSWLDATPLQREQALQEATRDVDSHQFIGNRFSADQYLEWPRSFLRRWPWALATEPASLESLEQARMRESVKRAVCHQALFLLSIGGRNKHADNLANGVESYTEITGPVAETVKYRPGALAPKLCSESKKLLAPWLVGKKVYRA